MSFETRIQEVGSTVRCATAFGGHKCFFRGLMFLTSSFFRQFEDRFNNSVQADMYRILCEVG